MELPFQANIKDKVVVITGAGGVLCGGFALALAQCGAHVALLDLNEEAAKAKAKTIEEAGFSAKGYACNVLDKASIEGAHEAIVKDFGTCDILINGAGGNNPKATTNDEFFDPTKDIDKTFFDLDSAGIRFVFDLNFLGTLLPSQVFAKDMIGKQGCSIINISSMNAYTPLTKIPAYSGAKAAVSNFTQWLAVYLSRQNIRVNAMAPGFFSTQQNKALLWNEDGTPTARTKKILDATPMGRFGEVEELIGTLLYLVDPKASGFVSGVVIPIDGGFSSYSGV